MRPSKDMSEAWFSNIRTVLKSSLCLGFFIPMPSWAEVKISAAEEIVYKNRNSWFWSLRENILNQYPAPHSEAANLDRLSVINYALVDDQRLALARADSSQKSPYKLSIMSEAAFGGLKFSADPTLPADLKNIASYQKLKDLYALSGQAFDLSSGKYRAVDFILKDDFSRGRPKDVLNKASEYIDNYIDIQGSSFPSGHTWDGYEAANTLSLIFPERGAELVARALQYGESRLVLKMHFPTDTIASRVGNYYYLSKLLENDDLASSIFDLSKDVRTQIAESTGCANSLRRCLEDQPSSLADAQSQDNFSLGYYNQLMTRPSVELAPYQIPEQASHLLRLRFPYLPIVERRQILASTAYPSNSLAAWNFDANNPNSSWGLINLPRAYAGPTYFYDDFTVNQNPSEKLDLAGFGTIDEWREDIAGTGGLIKNGNGTLILTGNNTFSGGIKLNQGVLQVGNGGITGAVVGDVSNNSALIFNRRDDLVFDGNISGLGALIKDGAGGLTLSGSNSYSSGTTINEGSLSGTANSFGSGPILNNATLVLDQVVDARLPNNISGRGALTKDGAGSLILSDSNSYNGGTTVNGGTLSGTATSFGAGHITNNARLLINQAGDTRLLNSISGNGLVVKNGAGSLVLAGKNTYSGGTEVNGGALVGSVESFGTGKIINSATLVLDQGSDAILPNHISGVGSISKTGVGRLILGHENSYSGVTKVNEGTLVGSANSFGTGPIVNNASLVVDQAADASLPVSISGSGKLSKLGNGALTLNGNVGLVGGTDIYSGSLIVGGEPASHAALYSNTRVHSGAVLGGHGYVIGNIELARGATLSPGASIGNLRIIGDINFSEGASLRINANPNGQVDQLTVSGTVALDRPSLNVVAGDGRWAASTHFSIIQADSVTGHFSTLTSNLAFLTPLLTYSSNGVDLELQRNDISLASVGETGNQRAVANALQSAKSGVIFDKVLSLSDEQARTAFDSLSGELHTNIRGVLLDESRHVRESIGNRLYNASSRFRSDGILHRDTINDLSIWLGGYGNDSDKKGNHGYASLHHHNKGSLIGVDFPASEHWRVGLAAGYGSSRLNLGARDSSSTVDSTTVATYLGGQWDEWSLRLGLARSWSKIESKRGVNVGDLQQRITGHHDADTTQVFSEIGYAIRYGDLRLEPFIGLTQVEVDSDKIRERGNHSGALSGESTVDDARYSNLGLRFDLPFIEISGKTTALRGGLSWQHALELPDSSQRMSLKGYDSFTTSGVSGSRDTAIAQVGISLELSPEIDMDLNYSGQIGSGTREHGAQLGLNFSF